MALRIIFGGTPSVALPTLAALVESEHSVVGVVTRPPKRRGRSKALVPSEVAVFAQEHGIPLLETERPRDDESLAWIKSARADLGVVVAFGALLTQSVLDALPLGWINLHFSSLPDLRGAAPVQRALLRGDTELGSSVFQLERGMDTGPVFSSVRHSIDPHATAGEALEYLGSVGPAQVVAVVDALSAGTAVAVPQDTGVYGENISQAPKLARVDGFIDFKEGAGEVVDRVRGVTPDPGAWTTLPDGSVMKLGPLHRVSPQGGELPTENDRALPGSMTLEKGALQVACGDSAVQLGEVGPAGKKRMAASDWFRGARLPEGARLGGAMDGGK